MMKKTALTLIFALISMLMAQAQSSLFSKYENHHDVAVVVVSKAMFRMMPNVNVGGRNIKKIASKIDNLRVLSCERQAIISKIAKDAQTIYGKTPWEEVMRIKEQGSNTVIYMRDAAGGKYEYVLYSTDKGELNIIDIIGNITLNEIKEITN